MEEGMGLLGPSPARTEKGTDGLGEGELERGCGLSASGVLPRRRERVPPGLDVDALRVEDLPFVMMEY